MPGADERGHLFARHAAELGQERNQRASQQRSDDVLFTRPRETVVRRTTAALRALPSTWWGLYLGHVPIQAYFLRLNLLRVRSGCTHAYIANAPLLAWLASTPPMSAEVAMSHWIGPSIDAAMSSLPECTRCSQ